MKNYAIITTSFMVSVFTLPNAYGLQHNTYDECSDHWDKKYYTTHNKYNNLTISSKHSCTLLSSLGTYRECIFYWKNATILELGFTIDQICGWLKGK